MAAHRGDRQGKVGHVSAYEEMNYRTAGSELLNCDTAAHNICEGYATRWQTQTLSVLS